MFITTRRIGEKLYIGDNVVITVTEIDHKGVRLAISAPRDVPIYRQENLPIHDARRQEEGRQS